MSPKTARNLSLVALFVLYQPCRNLLAVLDLLCRIFFHTESPLTRFLYSMWASHGQWAYIGFSSLTCLILPLVLSILLYRYLLRRDFAQVCADCAARKIRLTVLFILFAFFTVFQIQAIRVPVPADSYPQFESISDVEYVDVIDDPAL